MMTGWCCQWMVWRLRWHWDFLVAVLIYHNNGLPLLLSLLRMTLTQLRRYIYTSIQVCKFTTQYAPVDMQRVANTHYTSCNQTSRWVTCALSLTQLNWFFYLIFFLSKFIIISLFNSLLLLLQLFFYIRSHSSSPQFLITITSNDFISLTFAVWRCVLHAWWNMHITIIIWECTIAHTHTHACIIIFYSFLYE